MLSFRKKVLVGGGLLFCVFMLLLVPLAKRIVDSSVENFLARRIQKEIVGVQRLSSIEEVIDRLKEARSVAFFRATLFDAQGDVLYDSLAQGEGSREEEHEEVEEALKKGRGFRNRYSSFLHQQMTYAAGSFEVDGEQYVLRIGIPFDEMRSMMHEFRVGFFVLGVLFFLLYGIVIWTIIHRLSAPIQEIIDLIRPYQEGKEEFLPTITIQETGEFGNLARTLNSMNDRIKQQIETLVEQREETEEILESLGEGVIAVDREGKILFVNAMAAQMLMMERAGALRKRFNDIKMVRGELASRCQELLEQTLLQGESLSAMTVQVQGKKFFFDLFAKSLVEKNGVVLVIQDKTSDYRVLEMGKEFVSNASHELRTPLTIIRGFAESLRDLPNLSQELLREISEKILKTSIRLEVLVKSLLKLADVEGFSEEQLVPVDIGVVVEGSVKNLLAAHSQVAVSVHKPEESVCVKGDQALLEMALGNLLENAVRYSSSPAQIEISIASKNHQAQLTIADRGVGIPEADLAHVFDRFYTVDKARSRKLGGAGLGLSIVKAVIQKHYGKINVVSKVGQGTTFTLELPLSEDVQ